MIARATLSLVLLVSCAHAMVHVYELSFPGVEQTVARDYFPDQEAQGKRLSGYISNSWRITWGLGALAAGWLVDRFGSRRMLAIYLLGCAGTCFVAGLQLNVQALFVVMMAMGAFASIYHPAGLALISHNTTPENRARALGIHGIFGSAGIAGGPLLAGTLLQVASWRQFYVVLAIPGLILGCVFIQQAMKYESAAAKEAAKPPTPEPDTSRLSLFYVLTIFSALQGFVYSGLMSFLPRYLSGIEGASGNFYAAGVLVVGCVGQFVSGRMARPSFLEGQLAWVSFANVPFLAWMAFAQGRTRLVATTLLVLVHFMQQPVYNSLIAKYTPAARRSLCYGISFAIGLGLGSFGATFAGTFDVQVTYVTLAAVTLGSTVVAVLLWWMDRQVHVTLI